MSPGAVRARERGFTALAAILLVAAAMALALIALNAGQGARVAASTGNDGERARAIAEVGLERTRAYLGQILATQIDLDQALDPKLDDDCTTVPYGNTADDNLPPFADGAPFTGGPGGRSWIEVPSNGGAYLVRIDDDDDDQLNPTGPAVGNHAASGCVEGAAIAGISREQLVRDTNQTVLVTVVGVYPGTDVAHALAVKTLRATVGAPPGFGVAAGGDISLSPASDDVTGNVIAAGNIDIGGTLAGSARAAGTCNPAAGCTASAEIPPMPKVDPWDVTNAPLAGSGVNFYYAAYDSSSGNVLLYSWDYGACPNPRAFGRICYPFPAGDPLGGGACATNCWRSVAQPPGQHIKFGPNTLWDVAPATPLFACSMIDPDMYPSTWPAEPGSYWTPDEPVNATFQWNTSKHFGSTPTVPGSASGVWLVAGNVNFNDSTAADCSDQASIIALGDITLTTGNTQVNLEPAAPKPYILLAGRDLQLHTGGGGIDTCNVPAAVLVHEQLEFQTGNDSITAQVVVQNASDCSTTAEGAAILGHGHDGIDVPFPPPIGIGPSAVLLDFEESGF